MVLKDSRLPNRPVPAPAGLALEPKSRLPLPSGTGSLQIFAEGIAWFEYPVPFFGGGIIPLEDRLGVPVLNLAKAGDEVRFMMGVEQRRELAKRFTKGCPAGGPWDVLLFSGGVQSTSWTTPWLCGCATSVPPCLSPT